MRGLSLRGGGGEVAATRKVSSSVTTTAGGSLTLTAGMGVTRPVPVIMLELTLTTSLQSGSVGGGQYTFADFADFLTSLVPSITWASNGGAPIVGDLSGGDVLLLNANSHGIRQMNAAASPIPVCEPQGGAIWALGASGVQTILLPIDDQTIGGSVQGRAPGELSQTTVEFSLASLPLTSQAIGGITLQVDACTARVVHYEAPVDIRARSWRMQKVAPSTTGSIQVGGGEWLSVLGLGSSVTNFPDSTASAGIADNLYSLSGRDGIVLPLASTSVVERWLAFSMQRPEDSQLLTVAMAPILPGGPNQRAAFVGPLSINDAANAGSSDRIIGLVRTARR